MSTTRVIAATRHDRPRRLAFDIDFADGTVSNLSGENVDAEALLAIMRSESDRWPGFVTFPWMETHAVAAPFRDPQGMAWSLIASGFEPEGVLAAYPAPEPAPLPPDAVA